ncbi:hypothetical protein C7E12_18995, partial [Stenotrophomonas maltophilia]
MAGYLLFATERYALPILAPLARALHVSGQEVAATTTISSQKASEARQSPMRPASLNAIMQAEMRG